MALCDCLFPSKPNTGQSYAKDPSPGIRRHLTPPEPPLTAPLPTSSARGPTPSPPPTVDKQQVNEVNEEREDSLANANSAQQGTEQPGTLEPVSETVQPVLNPEALSTPRSDNMEDVLYEKILSHLRQDMDKKNFVPADAIGKLACEEVIRSELQGKTGNVPLASVVEYVLHKPAIKVFLILASIDHTDAMLGFYHSGLTDRHLPIEEKTNGGSVCREWAPAQSWKKSKHRHDFTEYQWRFLTPVFTNEQFVYTLDKRCPLPITRRDQSQQGGLTGSVAEVEVHEAHQKVLEKVYQIHYTPSERN
jgi:hypothetical protein